MADLSYLTKDESMTGMPANLAAAATRNLAREDAAVGRFNSVASQIPIQASQVTAQPASTPVAPAQPTDAGGLDPNIIDRGMVDRHRALQAGLASGIDPDAPARFIRPDRREQMIQEADKLFPKIQAQSHAHALERAAQHHESLLQQKDIATANAVTGLIKGISSIKAKPGTPEYEEEFLHHVSTNPDALDSTNGNKIVSLYANAHDNAMKRNEALSEAAKKAAARNATPVVPEGYSATLEHVGPDGPSYNIKPVEPNIAAVQPADEYASADLAQQEHPDVPIKQNPKTGGFYPDLSKGTQVDQATLRRYAATQADLADPTKVDTHDAAAKEAAILESQFPELKQLGGDAAPKALDADTARALVKEAGGDKAKARELAKQRGYQF